MPIVITLVFALMLGATTAIAQTAPDCETATTLNIPCATYREPFSGPSPDPPKHLEFQEPLFNPDNVAKDSPPEQVEMLNHPTWENAHKAALARIYRNYKIFVATQMIMAVQKAIVDDVKQRFELTDKDYMKILEIIVREHGLPTLDLEASGVVPDPLLESATRALSGVSGGKSP